MKKKSLDLLANECVSKDLAMKAAKYFFENLKPHPDLKWED